jgi:hypothetical protein
LKKKSRYKLEQILFYIWTVNWFATVTLWKLRASEVVVVFSGNLTNNFTGRPGLFPMTPPNQIHHDFDTNEFICRHSEISDDLKDKSSIVLLRASQRSREEVSRRIDRKMGRKGLIQSAWFTFIGNFQKVPRL